MACWGDNTFHQIGPSSEPQHETPRLVSELPPAAALRCGAFETCVLTADGGLHCLGGPPRVEALEFGQPARDAILGGPGGCALLRDGTISCWARPPAGEGSSGPSRFPRAVAGPRDGAGFVAAPAFASAFCARRPTGPPACFGADGTQAVTSTSAGLAGAADLVMARATGAPLCARFSDGRVTCLDPGVPGLVGGSLTVPSELRLSRLLAPRDGGFCGVAAAGSAVRCVGDSTPLVEAIPADVTHLAFGGEHACAVAHGVVHCWGSASHGQLGAGGAFLHPRPVRVPGVTDAVQLDASAWQVCALRRGGGAVCWGQPVDENGRLQPQSADQPIETPPGTEAIRASGFAPSVGPNAGRGQALCARGTGKRGWRCLSREGWKPAADPVAGGLAGLPAGKKLRQLGRDGSCGVNAAGRLLCVPSMAVGTTQARASAPVIVESSARFVAAASVVGDGARRVVCGLAENKHVACFHLEAGRGGATSVDSPSIGALTDVEQLSAGGQGEESLTCARTSAGGVSCWGDGRYGQLGPAAPNGRLVAVPITGLPPVVEIAVGGTFACGRTSTGDVYCWGSNRDGAAPDGTPRVRAVPVTVSWPTATPSRR